MSMRRPGSVWTIIHPYRPSSSSYRTIKMPTTVFYIGATGYIGGMYHYLTVGLWAEFDHDVAYF